MHCSIAYEAARAFARRRYEHTYVRSEVRLRSCGERIRSCGERIRSCGYEAAVDYVKLRLRNEAAQPMRMSRGEAVHTAFVLP